MARPRKARVEGSLSSKDGPKPHPNPVPGDDGEALERIVASFKHRFPEDWDAWAKCALESGLPVMAKILKGKG